MYIMLSRYDQIYTDISQIIVLWCVSLLIDQTCLRSKLTSAAQLMIMQHHNIPSVPLACAGLSLPIGIPS